MKPTKSNILSGRPITTAPIPKNVDVVTLVENYFHAYNAGRLREACQVFSERMLEPDVTIGMSLTGALTPAGLGGSCIECEQVQHYGTAHDLLGDDWSADWTEVEALVGWGASATYLGCAANPSYHLLLTVEPLADHLLLTEPIFIATFNVWKEDPVPPGCPQPPSNLAAMFGQGGSGYWNYVQLGGLASIGSSRTTWTALKQKYRGYRHGTVN